MRRWACRQWLERSDTRVLQPIEGLPIVQRVVQDAVPLCATCRSCPEITVCGGGYLPHRYSRMNGFDNPFIWCVDILKLIAHLRNKIGFSKSVSDGLFAARTRTTKDDALLTETSFPGYVVLLALLDSGIVTGKIAIASTSGRLEG